MVQFYRDRPRKLSEKRVEVTIDSLDQFGQGVSRYQGKMLFVAGALPMETVEVTITEEKRQFARGKVLKLLSQSQQRVQPKCHHYSHCGGCQQQHISLLLQQQSKSQSLCHLLAKASGQPISLEKMVTGKAWAYRRRARLSLNWDKQRKQLIVGYRAKASHQVVAITDCPVLEPALAALITPLSACLNELQSAATLGHIELIAADNGLMVILRHTQALNKTDKGRLQQFAQQHTVVVFLDAGEAQLQPLSATISPYYQISDLALQFTPRDFIQVNRQVNQGMVTLAAEWLEINPSDQLLDLFCGMGNFSLPLAKVAQTVIGVEGVATLVQQARENAKRLQFLGAEFWLHNLELGFAEQTWAKNSINKVLLDPARAGAAQVIADVAKLAPSHILYVSCNPATLARDAEVLIASGYTIAKAAMLDMFPHTSHLESMVLFKPKS